MAIIVTCPGCRKSFSVRDEFGGKKGPCPKCKTIITIPMPDKTVKVHGGEAFSDGGRTTAGELVLKPIKRIENRFSPVLAFQIIVGVLIAFAVAWFLGGLFAKFLIMRILALLVVTPPLVYAPYFFLRDSEAIAYIEERELWMRTALCAGTYLALWAGFAIFAHYTTAAFGYSLWTWVLSSVPFVLAGVGMGAACYNLEWGDGAIHFVFYLVVTLGLALTAGVSFQEGDSTTFSTPPASQAPAQPGADGAPVKSDVPEIPLDPRR